jgi:nucleotide sugar dehydrogenase
MIVNVIGVGKLGLAYAAFISSRGHTVRCTDKSETLIASYKRGEYLTNEPGVVELAQKYPMEFSTEISEADLSIILVNTPTSYAGYDHSILESVLATVKGPVIVTCTVQPGFCDRYNDRLIYNPLFVQIGNVIANLEAVTDVLIGDPSRSLGDFYRSLYGPEVSLHYMSYMEAEVAKLSLNSFITTKISFANMVGDALRRVGQPADAVLNFIGSDGRVGPKCLKYGWGYGGPCFPRDNRALSTFLRESGSYDYLPLAAHESNERHAMEQAIHYTDDTIHGMCYKDDCAVPVIEESHKVKTALIRKSMGRPLIIDATREVIDMLPAELKKL